MKDRREEQTARVRIRVTGQVQGVGFRVSARRRAADLGLSGTAENQPDGSVLIEMQGARPNIDQFVAWCHRGPTMADVQTVHVTEL